MNQLTGPVLIRKWSNSHAGQPVDALEVVHEAKALLLNIWEEFIKAGYNASISERGLRLDVSHEVFTDSNIVYYIDNEME